MPSYTSDVTTTPRCVLVVATGPVSRVMLALHAICYIYSITTTCTRFDVLTPAMRDEAAELLS
jgi:hypothetical protein